MHPGQMLPAERKLAQQHSISHMTLRKVLDKLEYEGYVKRYPGRGTTVADPLQQGEFAVVIRPALMKAEASPVYRDGATLLAEKICTINHNNKWFAKLHLGQQTDRGEDFPGTLDLLQPDVVKRLRGVFTFHPLFEVEKALVKKNIPVVGMGESLEGADANVAFDRTAFCQTCVNHLRQVGCRTVGFVWNDLERHSQPEERIDDHFAKCAIDAGFTIKEQWLPKVSNDISERKGYELFMKFWEQGDCPDGIVVNDDIVAKGVLRAVLHKRIRIPEQLRLITFANKGIELPFHKPVTRYEFDVEKKAILAVETMVKLVEGQELESKEIFVPGKLIKGATT